MLARFRRLLAMSIAITLTLTLAGVSKAEGPSAGGVLDVPDGHWYDPQLGLRDDALAVDAARRAAVLGVSSQRVLNRLEAEERASDAIAELEANH